MSNLVKAVFGSSKMTTTRPLWQYDHGMVLQFIGVNLPTAYQVHFANSESGEAKTALGNADGVEIIDEYFLPGSDIYAWVYVNEGDSGHTVYMARIPVLKKALPTDQQPTPVQQTAIEDAIDALNDAADGIPTAINTALAEAKASGEFDGDPGEDGYSPTVTITDISGGHRVTITDAEGEHSFDVMDGSGGGGGTSDYSDLSNKPSIEGVTLAGNKTASDLGLAKASDIPAAPVQSVNNKTGAVVLNASDVGAGTYSKPSGGIPKSDLASAVQNSLSKADTALQSAPVTSVNGQTGAVTVTVPTKTSDLTNDSGFVNAAGAAAAAPVSSVNGQTGAVSLSIPSAAADVGAVAVTQGLAHAGEFVVVGSDGNITTVTMTAWQGGSY